MESRVTRWQSYDITLYFVCDLFYIKLPEFAAVHPNCLVATSTQVKIDFEKVVTDHFVIHVPIFDSR